MNRIQLILLSLLLFSNCSFNENSRIWNKNNEDISIQQNQVKILGENIKLQKEFNPSLQIELEDQNTKKNENFNFYGSQEYLGKLNKIRNFKFSKFQDLSNSDLKPLISDNALVFFDKKGSLIKYNKNAQIIWKKNFYSKSEKKLSPKLSFALQNDKLIVVDNVANFYLVDFENGNLVWSKKNEYPFNSEVKIFRDKFFAIDYNNNIKCFNIADGTNCWTLPTENAFTIPNNKYSLILVNDLIIFNNSIGDITALNAVSGSIIWQLPTQSRSSIMQTYNLQTSKLVTDGNSIFFSNNKNEFYSLDLKTGSVNWKNEVNSLLTPIILNDLIFTVSDEGYLFVIQKDKGNIIRINDLYSYFKEKKRKSIEPTGFIVADKKLYLTNNNGNLIIVDLVTGSIMNVIKIGRDIILQPQIHNKNLYLIKNGNIISYD